MSTNRRGFLGALGAGLAAVCGMKAAKAVEPKKPSTLEGPLRDDALIILDDADGGVIMVHSPDRLSTLADLQGNSYVRFTKAMRCNRDGNLEIEYTPYLMFDKDGVCRGTI